MERKGQAAMEFLMTYGWAILAAIIVIGVLAIYFRPSSMTPQAVMISAPFYGVAATAVGNTVNIEVRNNGGESLLLPNITLALTSPVPVTCTPTYLIGTMAAGQTNVTTFACTGLASGSSYNGDITMRYMRTGSNLVLTSGGTVSGKSA